MNGKILVLTAVIITILVSGTKDCMTNNNVRAYCNSKYEEVHEVQMCKKELKLISNLFWKMED